MNEAAVLALINLHIVANGSNEITADVLRPILQAMLAQPNDKIGELGDLDTTDKTTIVNAINELVSASSGGFIVHSGTPDPNVTPPGSFGIGDWYVRSGTSLYQYNGTTWVLLKSAGTVLTDDVEYQGAPLANIPVSNADSLTTIIGNIDSALGDRYTKSEADAEFANVSDLIDSTEIDTGNDLLIFKDSSDATLFTQNINAFRNQAVTVEVTSNSVVLKDKDDNILSTASLPTVQFVEDDFNILKRQGNTDSSIEDGDRIEGWEGFPDKDIWIEGVVLDSDSFALPADLRDPAKFFITNEQFNLGT